MNISTNTITDAEWRRKLNSDDIEWIIKQSKGIKTLIDSLMNEMQQREIEIDKMYASQIMVLDEMIIGLEEQLDDVDNRLDELGIAYDR